MRTSCLSPTCHSNPDSEYAQVRWTSSPRVWVARASNCCPLGPTAVETPETFCSPRPLQYPRRVVQQQKTMNVTQNCEHSAKIKCKNLLARRLSASLRRIDCVPHHLSSLRSSFLRCASNNRHQSFLIVSITNEVTPVVHVTVVPIAPDTSCMGTESAQVVLCCFTYSSSVSCSTRSCC